MPNKSNADFSEGAKSRDSEQELEKREAERDDTLARKTKDVEQSVRGNRGLSQAREDRGGDGSETEEALKRSTEQRNQNRI